MIENYSRDWDEPPSSPWHHIFDNPFLNIRLPRSCKDGFSSHSSGQLPGHPVCLRVAVSGQLGHSLLRPHGIPFWSYILTEEAVFSLLPGLQRPGAAGGPSFLQGKESPMKSHGVFVCMCKVRAVLQPLLCVCVYALPHGGSQRCVGRDLLFRCSWHLCSSPPLPRGSSECYWSDWHSCEEVQGSCLYTSGLGRGF